MSHADDDAGLRGYGFNERQTWYYILYARTHARTHTHARTDMSIYTHTHTYACMYSSTHAHTPSLARM